MLGWKKTYLLLTLYGLVPPIVKYLQCPRSHGKLSCIAANCFPLTGGLSGEETFNFFPSLYIFIFNKGGLELL